MIPKKLVRILLLKWVEADSTYLALFSVALEACWAEDRFRWNGGGLVANQGLTTCTALVAADAESTVTTERPIVLVPRVADP